MLKRLKLNQERDRVKKQLKRDVLATLHQSRQATLTFLADRQFKTAVLVVTVNLIAADRLLMWVADFTLVLKVVATTLLLTSNAVVFHYLYVKRASYKKAKEELKVLELDMRRLVYALADDQLGLPISRTGSRTAPHPTPAQCDEEGTGTNKSHLESLDQQPNRLSIWMRDGTAMFSSIILVSLIWALISIWFGVSGRDNSIKQDRPSSPSAYSGISTAGKMEQ